jgi:hypothetical protein
MVKIKKLQIIYYRDGKHDVYYLVKSLDILDDIILIGFISHKSY